MLSNSIVVIKNVILYDLWHHVCGFAEFRTESAATAVKVRFNLCDDLVMSISAEGKNYEFNLTGKTQRFEINSELNLTRCVRVCVMKRDGKTFSVLANGSINASEHEQLHEDKSPMPEKVKPNSLHDVIDETEFMPISRKNSDGKYDTRAACEIDELLRKVCSIRSDERGECETCPYREHFFGESPS